MAMDPSASPAAAAAGDDLSALAWVHDELRRSLELAHKALRRYLKERAQKTDLDSVDPAVLRQARNQLHQCVGVLELVNLGPAAELPRAAEAALQRISARPKLVTPAAVDTLERGSFALLDYIARRLVGKPVSTLALFPQYKALQELAGALRVHPADLWDHPWAWRELAPPVGVAPRHPDAGTVAQIEADLLALMRGTTAPVAARMSEVFAGLAAGARAGGLGGAGAAPAENDRLASLWLLAAGFFEAQADGLLASDAYSKRLGSKLLAQLRAGEAAEPSERLAHDLLFFCAQADLSGGRLAGPRLQAVRRGHALPDAGDTPPVDYQRPVLGRFDPAWVAQARKRVAGAKEVWSAVAAGELARRDSLAEQFALVGDSLNRLYADGAELARALQDTAAQAAAQEAEPPAELAMEVATALLYLDASIEDADFDRPGSAQRVRRLAGRIDAVRNGQDPGALEQWMEELYRRVSDRQTMGSVVQELRAALSEVEKNIDQYFRNPAQREVLIPVPGQLQAMRGVLSVLGLEQASLAVLRMRDEVDALANTEVDTRHAIGSGSFERLADNLGALSFLIDMVSVQPQLAKSLFQFDAATGSLRAVMAREARPTGFDEPATQPGALHTDTGAVTLEFERIIARARGDRPADDAAAAAGGLPILHLDGAPTLDLAPLAGAGDPLLPAFDDAPTLALPTLPMGAPDPAPAAPLPAPAPAPAVSSGLEDDPEMREIFLEEAAEVLDGARAALAGLHASPEDAEAMTTVRRAFHTLKGSARMVGLLPFGEAAWACEQLYNARLAAHAPADADLVGFSEEACAAFAAWVQALARNDVAGHGPEAIVRGADALRHDGRRLPLGGGAVAPAGDGLVNLDLDGLPPRDLDLDLPAPAPAAPVAATPAPDDFALDLRLRVPDLPSASDLDLGAPPTEPPPLPDIPLDFLADDAPTQVLPRLPQDSDAPSVPETLELDLGDELAAAFDMPGVAHQAPPAPPAPQDQDAAAGEDDADAVRQVGPLRISLPLFNIYLGEADDLSRRLSASLADWAPQPLRAIDDDAVALAHSLAGSSGTVGFADLAQLARALEHALERTQARGHGDHDEAALYTRAADEIHRLLHLFAAGFLQQPDAEVLARLQVLAHAALPLPPESVPGELAPLEADAEPEAEAAPPGAQVLAPAEAVAEPAAAASAEPVAEPDSAPAAEPVAQPHADADPVQPAFGRAALLPFAPLAELPGSLPAQAPEVDAAPGAIDEDIDAVDALDDELLPIFSEEADELLPVLHGSLRDWARAPGDASAPSACMRCLHTFKGSARLAGAMRLGEMAHRLETLVQRLAAPGAAPAAADIEALAGQADLLQARLDALLHPGTAAGEAEADVLATAVVPVPVASPAAPVAAAPAPAPADATPPTVRPADAPATVQPPAALRIIDWHRFAQPAVPASGLATPAGLAASAAAASMVRVRAPLLDRLVNQAGEVSISRARIETDVGQFKAALNDLNDNLERLRTQLRDIELQAETQIETRMEAARAAALDFDPLELDRFTRFQELTRMMAESVADVATVQRGLQRTLQSTEDALAHQARMNRDMQDDLLRTRMVEFEGLSERLYRVVRQAAKETGKPVRLDILGGRVEIDRGVLDRMTPAFEHLLRNGVVHGIEPAEVRSAAGKDATGTITLAVTQVGNEVTVEVRDDGAGLNMPRILARARALGLVAPDAPPDEAQLANLIFQPGFTTADSLTGLAGRGVGMDVVRTEVNAIGGRIETASAPGQGSSFRVVLPLTTAVTRVVMLRCGERDFAVPSTLVETVRRVPLAELEAAYRSGSHAEGDQVLPFFWLDALLDGSARGVPTDKTAPIVVIRSAQQRLVLHVDEVLGNQEVVVKNLGPQLSRVPGLVGMTLLPSGLPALIYNPVALATLYGAAARAATDAALLPAAQDAAARAAAEPLAPLVLVVDDSLTVRRITQRLLEREGYRVTVAKDGLDGLDKLAIERPAVLLTDIEMPRMDGFDMVRSMRGDSRLTGLPIIMITSRIAQKHRDVAAELGVDHYLGKPYAEDELLALVARHARGAPAMPVGRVGVPL